MHPNETGFFGGILDRSSEQSSLVQNADWQWIGQQHSLFLYSRGLACHLFHWDHLALIIRGRPQTSLHLAAEEIRLEYARTGNLSNLQLQGNLTLVLLDGQRESGALIRYLVGNSLTYYYDGPDAFYFSSNLTTLLDLETFPVELNRSVLPSLFLHRFTPGRDTLIQHCSRLLPGEQLTRSNNMVQRSIVQSYGQHQQPTSQTESEALDQLDHLLQSELDSHSATYPKSANLLSGGVDSTLLQAHFKRASGSDSSHSSFCVTVNHPSTLPDTDYALSAAHALGANHTLVPADQNYLAALTQTLATTGELPNHVQLVHFRSLAQSMQHHGFTHGLFGEAADSLFGMTPTTHAQMSLFVRRFCPSRTLRSVGRRLAQLMGRRYLARSFETANLIHDESQLSHPLNQIAIFTNRSAVKACFGSDAIEDVIEQRHKLLEMYDVSDDPVDRLHAMNLLGSAIQTASFVTLMFNTIGTDLSCPYLNSRVVRFALSLPHAIRFPFRRPKEFLKKALARQVGSELAFRRKLGFGQPVFDWLSPGGMLSNACDSIEWYDFLTPTILQQCRSKPDWFLYTLLCFDIWHKLFIQQSLPRVKNRWWEHEPLMV